MIFLIILKSEHQDSEFEYCWRSVPPRPAQKLVWAKKKWAIFHGVGWIGKMCTQLFFLLLRGPQRTASLCLQRSKQDSYTIVAEDRGERSPVSLVQVNDTLNDHWLNDTMLHWLNVSLDVHFCHALKDHWMLHWANDSSMVHY